MISRETLDGIASKADAVRAWPGILDLDEIQSGGNPAFWAEKFPRIGNPGAYVAEMSAGGDWTEFWRRAAPFGALMFSGKNGKWRRCPDTYGIEPGDDDCVSLVLEGLIKGRLDTEDPTYVSERRREGAIEDPLTLYWVWTRPSLSRGE